MFSAKAAAQIGHDILDRFDHGVIKGGVVAGGVDGKVHVPVAQMRHADCVGPSV